MEVQEIVARLDTLIKLQANALVIGMKSKKDKILFLGSTGLAPKLIADLVGTTPAAVSQTLYAERKKDQDAKTSK